LGSSGTAVARPPASTNPARTGAANSSRDGHGAAATAVMARTSGKERAFSMTNAGRVTKTEQVEKAALFTQPPARERSVRLFVIRRGGKVDIYSYRSGGWSVPTNRTSFVEYRGGGGMRSTGASLDRSHVAPERHSPLRLPRISRPGGAA